MSHLTKLGYFEHAEDYFGRACLGRDLVYHPRKTSGVKRQDFDGLIEVDDLKINVEIKQISMTKQDLQLFHQLQKEYAEGKLEARGVTPKRVRSKIDQAMSQLPEDAYNIAVIYDETDLSNTKPSVVSAAMLGSIVMRFSIVTKEPFYFGNSHYDTLLNSTSNTRLSAVFVVKAKYEEGDEYAKAKTENLKLWAFANPSAAKKIPNSTLWKMADDVYNHDKQWFEGEMWDFAQRSNVIYPHPRDQ